MLAAALTDLLTVPGDELDTRFLSARAGAIPEGVGQGIALLRAGSWFARPFAAWASTGWKGKVFDGTTGTLKNRLTPWGVLGIEAAVREDTSWVDGEPCIVLDYSQTSRVAHRVRDEIREVGPGVYLGVVFLGRRRLPIRFALTFG